MYTIRVETEKMDTLCANSLFLFRAVTQHFRIEVFWHIVTRLINNLHCFDKSLSNHSLLLCKKYNTAFEIVCKIPQSDLFIFRGERNVYSNNKR